LADTKYNCGGVTVDTSFSPERVRTGGLPPLLDNNASLQKRFNGHNHQFSIFSETTQAEINAGSEGRFTPAQDPQHPTSTEESNVQNNQHSSFTETTQADMNAG
jgi:hypothetical protein